jgi:hypothetical protein
VTKADQLAQMIVDIVSQDCESFQMIRKELADWSAERGMQFSEAQFRDALASAVRHGLIQTFRYQMPEQKFEAVPWDALALEGFYYLATKQGRATLQ